MALRRFAGTAFVFTISSYKHVASCYNNNNQNLLRGERDVGLIHALKIDRVYIPTNPLVSSEKQKTAQDEQKTMVKDWARVLQQR